MSAAPLGVRRNPRGRTTHPAAATAAQPSILFFVPPFARWAFPIFLLRKTSAGAAAATAAAAYVRVFSPKRTWLVALLFVPSKNSKQNAIQQHLDLHPQEVA